MGGIIGALIIGALAGFLAGKIMKGEGFGLIGNLIVGIIGAFIGKFLFGLLGVAGGNILFDLLAAVVGAIVLLFIVDKVKGGGSASGGDSGDGSADTHAG